jgi:hypothetical protein
MFTLPTVIEEQINRVDRQRSRIIGISSAVIAAWCAYRLIWLTYLAATFSGFLGSLVFSFVLWGAIGVVAAAAAVIFLQRATRLGAPAEGTPSLTTEA